jgi:hypothetical protein
MQLSTEVFVMVIFIAGGPFFYSILRDRELVGRRLFMGTYFFLLMSNIFTVIEEFWLNVFFNACEHISISIASILMFVAVMAMTAKNPSNAAIRRPDDMKG